MCKQYPWLWLLRFTIKQITGIKSHNHLVTHKQSSSALLNIVKNYLLDQKEQEYTDVFIICIFEQRHVLRNLPSYFKCVYFHAGSELTNMQMSSLSTKFHLWNIVITIKM